MCVKMFYIFSYKISERVFFWDGKKINSYFRLKSQVTNPISGTSNPIEDVMQRRQR
jgi:hypothetical protein